MVNAMISASAYGVELDRTIKDIASLGFSVESVSIVPVGLSDHREGLAERYPWLEMTADS